MTIRSLWCQSSWSLAVPPDPPLGPLALDLLPRATVRQLADAADELAALAHPIRIHPLPPGRRSRERQLLLCLRP